MEWQVLFSVIPFIRASSEKCRELKWAANGMRTAYVNKRSFALDLCGFSFFLLDMPFSFPFFSSLCFFFCRFILSGGTQKWSRNIVMWQRHEIHTAGEI